MQNVNRMSAAKRREAGNYIVNHLSEMDAREILNYPPTYKVVVATLPHNEVLNNEFWGEVGHREEIVLTETVDNDGRVNGWMVY